MNNKMVKMEQMSSGYFASVFTEGGSGELSRIGNVYLRVLGKERAIAL